MNKLIKFALPSALSLMLATPAMALTGYTEGSTPGPHWTNHFQGQGNWGNHSYGENAGRNGPYSSYGYYNAYGQRGQTSAPSYNPEYAPSRAQNNQNYGNNNGQYGQNNGQYGENNEGYGQSASHGLVAQLQHRLQKRGFYHQGNVDGLWGPETENALRNFQQQNNLRPTGQIDMRTLEALNMLNTGNGMQNGQQNGQQYGMQNGQQYGYNGGNQGPNNNNQGQNYNNNQSGSNGPHMGYNEGYNGQHHR